MTKFENLRDIIRRLRAEDGCPWDREQTHSSLKAACIEEAAEVICGINILTEAGESDSLKEELGDLLLQVLMHSQIAEEEGLFTIEDVIDTISEKMIRRHPHVFGGEAKKDVGAVLDTWERIKSEEKSERDSGIDERAYLSAALDEAEMLIETARKRKGLSLPEGGQGSE